MKTDLLQSCGHCWVFQICWQIECSTFTASSFRIWNSSTGIPSPPLALFVVILSKAHLTSHSRMSGRALRKIILEDYFGGIDHIICKAWKPGLRLPWERKNSTWVITHNYISQICVCVCMCVCVCVWMCVSMFYLPTYPILQVLFLWLNPDWYVCAYAHAWTQLSNFTFTFHFHALEKEMATHSSVLAWRIPGTTEPGGLPSMGSHRVGHDWSDLAAAACPCTHTHLPLDISFSKSSASHLSLSLKDFAPSSIYSFSCIFNPLYLIGFLCIQTFPGISWDLTASKLSNHSTDF